MSEATGERAGAEPALKLWVVLARAFNALARHTGSDIARHGLTPSEFAILETLFHKGPLLLGELQRKVLTSSGGITYLVDRLSERGLVQRRDCPTDRRARFAELTQAGEALIAEIFPAHAQVVRQAVDALTPEEREIATALLRKLGTHTAALPQSSACAGSDESE